MPPTSAVTIRPAVSADAAALVPLFEQWGHPQSREQIAAIVELWSTTPHAEILVATVEAAIAGVIAVAATPRFADPGRNAVVAGLVVAAEQRRHHVGSRLLDAAEAVAADWGCVRVELTSSLTRPEAHGFYRARGYEETSDRQARYVRPL